MTSVGLAPTTSKYHLTVRSLVHSPASLRFQFNKAVHMQYSEFAVLCTLTLFAKRMPVFTIL